MMPEAAYVVVKGSEVAPVTQVSPTTVQSMLVLQSVPAVGEHFPANALQGVAWTLMTRFIWMNAADGAHAGAPVPVPGMKKIGLLQAPSCGSLLHISPDGHGMSEEQDMVVEMLQWPTQTSPMGQVLSPAVAAMLPPLLHVWVVVMEQ